MVSVISRRRLRLLIALLLPLLAVRVLLPDGYMVSTESGNLRVVICPAGLGGLNPSKLPGQHHQHHHQQDDADQSPTIGEDCPFAHAAIHAPPPQLLAGVVTPVPEFRFVSRYLDQLPHPTGPPRQTSARAPPVSARSSIV
jgi:Protein of unknown function (DUF2946)